MVKKISDDYLGLNDEGEARAHCLLQVFNNGTIFGEPDSIYSNKRGTRSHRPYDTVKPLADSIGIPVQEFHKYKPEVFVKNTLNKDPSEIILISSAKEWIPSLLEAIGYEVDPEIEEFDNVWVVDNDDKKGNGYLHIEKQNIEECIKENIDKVVVNNIKIKN
jgi:broad specificity phosphatase PhoE